ncbi:Uncharacterized protein HZ326_19878 [Fusarium oxysporum f. sp. albedinis]|nr:Uncharacterized protein HZ326_19878 [Fusarium oxysporum f. sp. albedinis]
MLHIELHQVLQHSMPCDDTISYVRDADLIHHLLRERSHTSVYRRYKSEEYINSWEAGSFSGLNGWLLRSPG